MDAVKEAKRIIEQTTAVENILRDFIEDLKQEVKRYEGSQVSRD